MISVIRILTAISFMLVVNAPALADGTRAGAILTSEIAEKALGGPVKGEKDAMPDTEMGKIWVSRAHYSLASGDQYCGILIRHAASKEEAQSTFHDSKQKHSGVSVSGFGDDAYRVVSPMPQFNVLKGSNWLIITAGTLKAGDDAAQEKIAKAVLPAVSAN